MLSSIKSSRESSAVLVVESSIRSIVAAINDAFPDPDSFDVVSVESPPVDAPTKPVTDAVPAVDAPTKPVVDAPTKPVVDAVPSAVGAPTKLVVDAPSAVSTGSPVVSSPKPKKFVINTSIIAGTPKPGFRFLIESLVKNAKLEEHLGASITYVAKDFWPTPNCCRNVERSMSSTWKCKGTQHHPERCTVCANGDRDYVMTMSCETLEEPKCLEEISKEFVITRNPVGHSIPPLSVKGTPQQVKTKYAVVPKSGTLECLAILQKSNPSLTLAEFVAIGKKTKTDTNWRQGYNFCLVETVVVNDNHDWRVGEKFSASTPAQKHPLQSTT